MRYPEGTNAVWCREFLITRCKGERDNDREDNLDRKCFLLERLRRYCLGQEPSCLARSRARWPPPITYEAAAAKSQINSWAQLAVEV